ncbi:MAG TPA: hypothetical protein VNO18_20570, partial [Xanthobacteraceae bacterium]|nr:hypothetical protein [Xanthobacteraceae bacterium]
YRGHCYHGAQMGDYRVYQLDEDGHIRSPPKVFRCESDEAAIQRAERMVDGHDIELWQLDRLVIRLSPK